MTYTLGVDYGGSAVKATLLEETGKVAGSAAVEYKTYYPKERWAEQDPEELYQAFCVVCRKILSVTCVDADNIEALAISAGSQSGVYLDENDKIVRNTIYWADMRGIDYASRFQKEKMEYFLTRTTNQSTASRTLVQLMWIRDHEPEQYARIRKIMFTKDYIRYRLTGDFVTDYIDAMGSHFMDVPDGCWSGQLCEMAGIDKSYLPVIISPTDEVSHISKKAASETGLSSRMKVIAGSTDTVMETYANGAIQPGDMIVKLATAGRIITITDKPVLDPGIVNYMHVIPGLWYPGTGFGFCATSYRWFRDVLGEKETEDARKAGISPYELMNRLAENTTPGASDLYFLPFLGGSNVFPSRRAGFAGVRSDHTKGHFVRAVLEGVSYLMKESYGKMKELGLIGKTPVLIGGGARGKLWQQIMADMLNTQLFLSEEGDSSLGSAMLAGVASGIFQSFEESVEKCVRITGSVAPDPETVKIYDRGFEIYKHLVQVLDPVYGEMDRVIGTEETTEK